MTVGTQAVPNIIELPGRVQAYRTAEVRARVDGIVERRLFDEGSLVAAGKALFRIDPRQLTANVNAARAQLTRAQATAANARQVVGRYQPLLADQAIGKQEYDAAIAAQRTAEADVQSAQANLESARLNLGYSTVTAPIGGRARRAEECAGGAPQSARHPTRRIDRQGPWWSLDRACQVAWARRHPQARLTTGGSGPA